MDAGAAYGVLIPVVAVLAWMGSTLMRQWTRHQQEMARIRSTTNSGLGEGSHSELEAIRAEISRLRDTTTQYDMSVEHALSEIKQRLSTVENKTQTPYVPAPEQQPSQRVGIGSDQ